MARTHAVTAILPCNNPDASEAFYSRLGFKREGGEGNYRILSDGQGGGIHLTTAPEGWLVPGRNPFGIYLYTESVDELAKSLGKKPEDKPWGMYEFAISDPDETLVRIGLPSSMRSKS